MEISLDLIINTPPTVHQVDMKTGLDTMQGISDAVRTITETVVNQKIPEKKSSKNKIRTNMKNTIFGSYGIVFSVDAYDDAKELFNLIGKPVIVELIEYYLAEALDTNSKNLTPNAEKIRENLGNLRYILEEIKRYCKRSNNMRIMNRYCALHIHMDTLDYEVSDYKKLVLFVKNIEKTIIHKIIIFCKIIIHYIFCPIIF